MQRINFGIISSLLLATLLLSSCSSFRADPEIKIVVSPNENLEEFKKEFEAKNGGDAYIAISIKDYENLSNNFAELRRYIEQQKAIIVYYEEAVQPLPEEKEE